MIPLSVIVITRNEEKNIGECLESVRWANEIIVVDSASTDKTAEIAKQFTPNVISTEWKGYSESKNLAVTYASNSWVLWLDADERVTPELAKEISTIIESGNVAHGGYEMARRAYFLGKWIRHCGWYPGYVIRLFRREGAKFNDASVHERLEFSGTTGRL
ncbi:MAG TPA: glycosyltransferase family 2 protein, partial [Bacteroidota bacterium]|nr:glycosyltransferase family 2 protein [Bacteroidota bacterium]